ncbi:MAG: per [Chlamydiales bacterium]|jgi:CDP-6-deoxy-D-xylo-4-hexulose-3-dehydrase|nr:per [Chlamydiales bacterium]
MYINNIILTSDRKDDMSISKDLIRDLILSYCKEKHDFQFNPAAPRVRLHEASYSGEEIWEGLECLLSTEITMGKRVLQFEKEFAEYFKALRSIMVNSGSSANLLAVATLCNPAFEGHLKPGDEVIVPALSWSTTVWPIIQCGLIPVIVDCDPDTLNIDPLQIEKAIGPKTRAIKLVHVYGNPCDMDAIMQIAAKYKLLVIEDSCEAMGSSYSNQSVGTFGDIGTFSLYYSHHITTLEGGMCVTNNFELSELMRMLRAHGWVRELEDKQRYLNQYPHIDPRFLFVNVGFNLRPTELQGAFGSVQLPKLAAFNRTRRSNVAYWRHEFSEFNDIFMFQEECPKGEAAWFGFPLRLQPNVGFTVTDLMKFLNSKGIETRPIIAGNMAIQPAMSLYEHRVVGELPHSSWIMQHGFTFGNHHFVNEAAREYIAKIVKEFLLQNYKSKFATMTAQSSF